MNSTILARLSELSGAHAQLHEEQDIALLALGHFLRAAGYAFTTVTPATHKRVLGRKLKTAYTELRDIFGWNRPYRAKDLEPEIRQLIGLAQAARRTGALARANVRFATHEDMIFAHSGYPTDEADAVFFGPDTYRFLRFLADVAAEGPAPTRVADIGTGSGAGAIALARRFPDAKVVASDVNTRALTFAAINAALNGAPMIELRNSDVMADMPGSYDLIVSNPPYLNDAAQRQYRHGGGATGSDLSLRIVKEGIGRLSPGGRLALYTGVAIVEGRDPFKAEVEKLLAGTPWGVHRYREIDPDVFGEELAHETYWNVDRICVVGLVIAPTTGPS